MSIGRRLAASSLGLLLATCSLAADRVTVHLAGDSTMGEAAPQRRPETGWGEFLQSHFIEGRVLVLNHAQRGQSTRTFLSEGFWGRLLLGTKAGDYVVIQFGHNDGSKDEDEIPRGEYRINLTRFVSDARARGATPILATPIVRRRFTESGEVMETHGDYPDIVKAVAAATKTPLLDMQKISGDVLEASGREGSKALFQHLAPGVHPNYPNGLSDNVHLSPLGAMTMARQAAAGLKELKAPLAAFLK